MKQNLNSCRRVHQKNNSYAVWTVKVNKIMVSLPRHGEKEVLGDTPLFVCYDTTFKRKGNQPGLEVQHILQHLLPSTVPLLGKNGLDLRHQEQNHQFVLLLPAFVAGGPTPTGHNSSVPAGSHREGARQLKVTLYICNSTSTMVTQPHLGSFCNAKSSVNRKIPLASSHFSAVTWSFCSFSSNSPGRFILAVSVLVNCLSPRPKACCDLAFSINHFSLKQTLRAVDELCPDS